MNKQDRDNLLGILEQKKGLLSKMRDVTSQLAALLSKDDVDAFSDGLEQRQDIISKIDAFTRMERQMPETEDEQVKLLKEQSRDIIRDILKIDEQNAVLAQKKIEQYRAQIKSLNQQKIGIGQYTRTYQKNEAFYFDEKK
jgi:hypothetical protein